MWENLGGVILILRDPPYQNTTKYTGTPNFDSEEFWNIMRKWSKDSELPSTKVEGF